MTATIVDDLPALLAILPSYITDQIDCDNLIEVVLDYGRPAVIRYADRAVTLDTRVTTEELLSIVEKLGDFGDDNRAGIAGTLHRISAIRNRRREIIGLTCRVGYRPASVDEHGSGMLLSNTDLKKYVPRVPGVYKIQNNKTGKCYIGSSVNIHNRLLSHLKSLEKNDHHNKPLQRAYNKYGKEVFSFSIIRLGKISDMRAVEQNTITVTFYKNYNTERKVLPIDERHVQKTRKPLTEEHKQKLRDARKSYVCSEETKLKLSVSHIGKKQTEEAKQKVSTASRNRVVKDTTREKLSSLGKKRGHSGTQRMHEENATRVQYPALVGPDGIIYPSATNLSGFCAKHGLSQGNMYEVIHGRRKQHKGFRVLGGNNV